MFDSFLQRKQCVEDGRLNQLLSGSSGIDAHLLLMLRAFVETPELPELPEVLEKDPLGQS